MTSSGRIAARLVDQLDRLRPTVPQTSGPIALRCAKCTGMPDSLPISNRLLDRIEISPIEKVRFVALMRVVDAAALGRFLRQFDQFVRLGEESAACTRAPSRKPLAPSHIPLATSSFSVASSAAVGARASSPITRLRIAPKPTKATIFVPMTLLPCIWRTDRLISGAPWPSTPITRVLTPCMIQAGTWRICGLSGELMKCVGMGMAVDEARRNDHALGIDRPLGGDIRVWSDIDDLVAENRDVANISFVAVRTVIDRATRDQHIDRLALRYGRTACRETDENGDRRGACFQKALMMHVPRSPFGCSPRCPARNAPSPGRIDQSRFKIVRSSFVGCSYGKPQIATISTFKDAKASLAS